MILRKPPELIADPELAAIPGGLSAEAGCR
jgi:hypothetical protein